MVDKYIDMLVNMRKNYKLKETDIFSISIQEQEIKYIPITVEVEEYLKKHYKLNTIFSPIHQYNNFKIFDDLTYRPVYDYELLYQNIKKLTISDLKQLLRIKKLKNILK